MIKIKSILYATPDKLFLQFSDNTIRVLYKKDFLKNKPEWQKDIINKKWQKAKIDHVGDLVFDPRFDAGADTIKPKSKEATKSDLLNILNKKTTKQKLIEIMALL